MVEGGGGEGGGDGEGPGLGPGDGPGDGVGMHCVLDAHSTTFWSV